MEFTALCSENSLGRLEMVWETFSVHHALRQGLGVTVQFRVRHYRQEAALWAVPYSFP